MICATTTATTIAIRNLYMIYPNIKSLFLHLFRDWWILCTTGLTQQLIHMKYRQLYSCRMSRRSRNPNLLEPQQSHQACRGKLLPFIDNYTGLKIVLNILYTSVFLRMLSVFSVVRICYLLLARKFWKVKFENLCTWLNTSRIMKMLNTESELIIFT